MLAYVKCKKHVMITFLFEEPSPYGPIRKVEVYPNSQQLGLVEIACKIVAGHRRRKWLIFRIGLRQTLNVPCCS